MSSSIPIATVAVQTIEPGRLPINSYRQRGLPYGRFQPFDLIGDSDALGNNQLNWISLFLVNKLGNPNLKPSDVANTDKILELAENLNQNSILAIKSLGFQLSSEFDHIKKDIENLSNSRDLIEKIKEEIKKIRGIGHLETRVSSLERKIDQNYELIKSVLENC